MILNPYAFGSAPPPVSGYAAEVLADSPYLYTRFGETSGTDAANIGTGSVVGTYVSVTLGQPSLCGDAADRSILFPSAGSSTRRVQYTGTSNKANDFTFECIIKPSAVSGLHGVMSCVNSGSAYLRIYAGKLNMLRSQAADLGSNATTLVAGNTYHVAVTVAASGTLTFYLNGVADGTGVPTNNFSAVGTTMNAGCEFSGQDPFSGDMDEVAVYYTELSAARILAHAQAAGLA